MRKILLLLLFLAFSCGSKTKKIDETETRKVQSSVSKQSDSIKAAEAKLTERTEKTVERIKSLNSSDDRETVTNTKIDYKGGEPLEIETPAGKLRISGSGIVNLSSEKKSKSSQQTHESDQQKINELQLSEANLKLEIRNNLRVDNLRVEEITKLKQKDVQRSRSLVWLCIALVVSILLNCLLCYLLFRKKTSVLGAVVS